MSEVGNSSATADSSAAIHSNAAPLRSTSVEGSPLRTPPIVLLSQIQIGPKLQLLSRKDQMTMLFMSVDRAFSQGEISFDPTATELHNLANECEGLAEAHLAAQSKIASLQNTSLEDNATLRPGTSKVASRWALSAPLPRLELAVSPNTEAPRHFHDAVKCKLYIPFNMFTTEHLETIAVTAKQTRWVDPDTSDKIYVPDTTSFINAEGSLSKSQWEEAYRNFIPVIQNACGPELADMFRRWHSLCQTHHLYRSDSDFVIILRFDISIRKQFFLKSEPFELGEYLFAGTNGIQRFAYEVQNERNAAALAAAGAYSGGPERTQKPRQGYARPPFQPSSRPYTAPASCCARCGRKSHRARDCSEEKLAKGGDIISDFRDGRFFLRNGNKELCFRFNTGSRCTYAEHSRDTHRCTLCSRSGHGAYTCSQCE
jgi:hypothetical protein